MKRQLDEAFNTYKFYLEEFERKKTKKAAVQTRKALSLVMKMAKAMRQEIQDEATKKDA